MYTLQEENNSLKNTIRIAKNAESFPVFPLPTLASLATLATLPPLAPLTPLAPLAPSATLLQAIRISEIPCEIRCEIRFAIVVPMRSSTLCEELPLLLSDSILTQTRLPHRVLIGISGVDPLHDTETSCLHAARTQLNSARVVLQWKKVEASPSAANSRNAARTLLYANESVVFHDADDYLNPQWLEVASWALTNFPTADAILPSYIQQYHHSRSSTTCNNTVYNPTSPFCHLSPTRFSDMFTTTAIIPRSCNHRTTSKHGCGLVGLDTATKSQCAQAPSAKMNIASNFGGQNCGWIHNAYAIFRRDPQVQYMHDVHFKGVPPREDSQFQFDNLKDGKVFLYILFPAVCYNCERMKQ